MEADVQILVNRYLSKSGKMIRPQLISLFGELFSLTQKDVELIARSAEMIHNASLIHDDVIDEAKLRRGEKSLNQLVSNSKAVLAGDFLLAQVIADLVAANQFEILKSLAETLQKIVEGEFLQDDLKTRADVGIEQWYEVAEKKTGALLAWCCSAAAIVAKKDPATVKRCETIGLKLGIVFQLIDDNLDYSEGTGKDYAKDLKEGLLNFPTLQLIGLYPELYYPVHQMRRQPFTNVPWSEEQIARAKSLTLKKAEEITGEIRDLLGSLSDPDTSALLQFMNFLVQRHS